MYVIKRSGKREDVHFDKITSRIRKLCYGLNSTFCDPVLVSQKVIRGIFPGITTEQLDVLSAETSAYMSTIHPDYSILAARISISNLHKSTKKSFSETIYMLYNDRHPIRGHHTPLVSEEVYNIVKKHASLLDACIIHDRDFEYDYFGFKTLEKSYLLRINGKPVERPQHMLMRVAIGIHGDDLKSVVSTYQNMSKKMYTHATPTLFNAGTCKPQMSSCFLLTMIDDSIAGIYETNKLTALISKHAGGIGLAAHNIRAKGSYIAGTNGISNGIVPMLRVFDATARYVDQGGGKRKGSMAIYLEPWHADIEDFLDLKKNSGKEENRARDLFYALWVPDLFMKRVDQNGDWTLFCPNEAFGLHLVYGKEFEALYEKYEKTPGLGRKVMKAQELWLHIVGSQMETGNPYMLFKDACNEKSNQKNLGTIQCSNLCTEIIQFTSPDEVAVCNLASINLRAFVLSKGELGEFGAKGVYNFDALKMVTKELVYNLNRVIDRNYYPVEQARTSNMRHRPIGLGIQGLADAFLELRYAFESTRARELNRDIFEMIYFAALEASCELAEKDGPYETYEGSPVSKGILQFDMWHKVPNPALGLNWDLLREKIAKHGVRNSLLVAPMPTASTSQILGNNEAFEPFTSNLYSRRVLSGDFVMLNRHLVKDLIELNLWNSAMKNKIVTARGSVQQIEEIPKELRELYKTVWEIKQRHLIDMAADRGAFIDQSQSLNIWMAEPTTNKVSSSHFHAWKSGLKTGMYYLRTKPKADPIQFTADNDAILDSRIHLSKQLEEAGNKVGMMRSISESSMLIRSESCESSLGSSPSPRFDLSMLKEFIPEDVESVSPPTPKETKTEETTESECMSCGS